MGSSPALGLGEITNLGSIWLSTMITVVPQTTFRRPGTGDTSTVAVPFLSASVTSGTTNS
jgi:hypothetical protein